ncbi:hypothetical protein ABTX80_36865 [Streptomyces erythrochromogenes]|uniref:dienelactone hydrolase family protein n=1 Tax=Streptomyces erythrochromogenes TaxID=285574 RepID=UPI00332B486E
MTLPNEARRICLSHEPQVAAEIFQRRGIDLHGLETLLYSVGNERERSRTETVELQDAWGRPTEMTLYVPELQGDQSLGVMVGLHGVGGSGIELAPYLRRLADACGAVLICPTAQLPVDGKSNFDLAGIFGSRFRQARWTPDPGDFPVRALRWARENLAVDVDRCALVGTSMGGIAAWSLASRHWAGLSMAASINGAPSIWELFGPDRAMRELLPNLLNLPFVVVHGSRDKQIPIGLDKEAVTQLGRLGHRGVTLVEVPDGEHKLSTMQLLPGNPQFDAVVQGYRASRRESWPSHVLHRARETESGRAHWIAMDGITNGETGSVEAWVRNRSHLDIHAVHASRIRLFLHDRILNSGRVSITVNGESRRVSFRLSMEDAISTYVESGADPGLMAHMVLDVDIAETLE